MPCRPAAPFGDALTTPRKPAVRAYSTGTMSPSTGSISSGGSSSSSSSSSRYEHHEAVVISPLAPQIAVGESPDFGSKKKLHIDVALEATSSVIIQPPHAGTTGGQAGLSATPFPSHVVELIKSHGLKRLSVQVGSSSSSSASVPTAGTSKAKGDGDGATGPVGTSITAELYTTADSVDFSSIDERVQSLLRSLVGSRLICAPLDSISIAKNQHYSYPHHNNDNATATYQIVLPASAGQFCAEGLRSFRRNLLPCRDHAGLLAKAPSSDVLLGTAPQIGTMRRGLWIDVSIVGRRRQGGNCFGNSFGSGFDGGDEDNDDEHCTVSLKQGSTYGVDVDAIIKGNTPEKYHFSSSFSLGDVLGGVSSALTNCPLAHSSEIKTILPQGVKQANFALPFRGAKINVNENENDREKKQKAYKFDSTANNKADDQVVHDIQSIIGHQGGAVSLDKKWISLELQGEAAPNSIGRNMLSVDRTVDKPKGVANGGTFHSVYRNGASDDEHCATVTVKTMDAYPKFVKPLPHTLKVRLYEGNGAGTIDFVPTLASVFVEVHDYKVTPKIDGSLSVEVVKLLPPDSSLWISLEYKPKFLSFEHFPSDPNRGVDVLPSTGVFFFPNTDISNGTRLYSPSVIIMPPVPDMSMPFNVISLACTLYAFIIGSMINLLVRKGSQSISDAHKGRKPRNKLSKLKQKLRKKLQSLRQRSEGIDRSGKMDDDKINLQSNDDDGAREKRE